MIQTLILDYNGVINDDFEYGYNAAMKVFDEFQLPRIPLKKAKEEFEIPVQNFYTKYLGDIPFDTFREEYFNIYTDGENPELFPKVKETLEELVKRNITLIILSSHKTEKIYEELHVYAINTDIFDAIYGSVENKLMVIDELVEQHSLNHKETAYVGDTNHDIETAKSAHIMSIAATYGYMSRKKLEAYHPDFFIDHFSQIVSIIQ